MKTIFFYFLWALLLSFSASLLIGCGGGYKLSGKVVNMEFREVPNAQVMVKDPNKKDSLVTTTDLTGSFRFENLKNRNIEITVSATDYQTNIKRVILKNEDQIEQIQLRYRPTRVLGRVLNSKTKEPLQNVLVKVLGTGSNLSVLTDQSGEFVLEGLDADLLTIIQFSRTNYNPQNRSVQPKLYRDVDLGDIYMTTIVPSEIYTSTEEEQLSEKDTEVSSEVRGNPVQAQIKNFLKETERFTRTEFFDKMREIRGNFSDEDIERNLQEYIRIGLIEEEGVGTYRSLLFER